MANESVSAADEERFRVPIKDSEAGMRYSRSERDQSKARKKETRSKRGEFVPSRKREVGHDSLVDAFWSFPVRVQLESRQRNLSR